MPGVQLLLDAAAHCRNVAREFADRLTPADHAHLTTAFHKAESLAHIAIEQAIDQVGPEYRDELVEQLEDEARHVAVFVRWLGEAPDDLPSPPVRQKPRAVWFASLLVNEVAGFCQFNMLAGLCGDPNREAEVLAVADDEIVHVQRLVRWLAPIKPTPEFKVVEGMVGRFVRRLDSRMYQFLPADHLRPLRDEMAKTTATLLQELTTRDSAS